jgi:hypothetical protein
MTSTHACVAVLRSSPNDGGAAPVDEGKAEMKALDGRRKNWWLSSAVGEPLPLLHLRDS